MYHVTVFLRDRSNAEGLLTEDGLSALKASFLNHEDGFGRVGWSYVPSPLDVAKKEDTLECVFLMRDVVQVRISNRPDKLRGYAPLK